MSATTNSRQRIDIVGAGMYSPHFANWQDFVRGVESREWTDTAPLQPELIPPKERRRAPELVKMAVEVMSQATACAKANANDVAVVFSSVMGDMQITDYLCRILADTPEAVSPTRFHNSVHNAAPGYWSIATGAFSAANAVSAFEYTASMALLEACIQVVTESQPVMLVTQEVAATETLAEVCPGDIPYSACILLAPATATRVREPALATFDFAVHDETSTWPSLRDDLQAWFGNSMSARLLPLMTSLATANSGTFRFPLSESSSISVDLSPPDIKE